MSEFLEGTSLDPRQNPHPRTPVEEATVIEPCLIPPLRVPELAEARSLGQCAKGCGGTILATAQVANHRVERRQYCTTDGCPGVIPYNRRLDVTTILPGVDQSPPAYLDEARPAENFDLAPDPKPAA